MKSKLFMMQLIIISIFSVQAYSQDFEISQELANKLRQAIELPSQGQLEIIAVNKTPLSQVYEVELNTGELLYSDMSGDYLFAGDLYQTTNSGLVNLSSETRQLRTVARIESIPEDQMIVYSPDDEPKATLTVFTDVDCTYCRALHRDVESLTAKGIEIRYLAYPRGGESAGSYEKMISVWCSQDRHKSLNQAKNGQNLPARDCETPVLEHYELGNLIGISGTPALIFPDGRLIPGYMDVDRLVSMMGIE